MRHDQQQGHDGAAEDDACQASAELSAAIQLNPLDWRLHITAAQAYVAKGLLQPALEAYRRGVDLLWQARLERDQDAPER